MRRQNSNDGQCTRRQVGRGPDRVHRKDAGTNAAIRLRARLSEAPSHGTSEAGTEVEGKWRLVPLLASVAQPTWPDMDAKHPPW